MAGLQRPDVIGDDGIRQTTGPRQHEDQREAGGQGKAGTEWRGHR